MARKASDWKKYDDILSAGTIGFNAMMKLPEILQSEISWLKDFKIGFCAEGDIPEWRSIGWDYLMTADFDGVDDFNKEIGLRFSVTDAAGHVKFRENYIMIMPKYIRDKVEALRNEKAEQEIAKTIDNASYAHPSDERYGEMKKASEDLSSIDHYQVQAEGAAESGAAPKKRGRPPKKK